MIDDNTTRPETVPELEPYSGPYHLINELVCEIGDMAALNVCANTLAPYHIKVQMVQNRYHETKCFMYPEGAAPVPSPDTRIYTLKELERICALIRSGEITLPDKQA